MSDFAGHRAVTRWSVVDSDTNAVVTATKAAPGQGMALYVTGISISASAAPDAPVTVELKDGSTVVDQWEVPAAVIAPIFLNFVRPFQMSENAAAVLTMEALGGGIVGTVVLKGYTSYAR